jgi:hypothetical protein
VEPIENVIRERADELLAIAGVAGVYEGRLPDGRPCIHVAVTARTPEVERRIPAEIHGYPTTIVESGPIGPLR